MESTVQLNGLLLEFFVMSRSLIRVEIAGHENEAVRFTKTYYLV